MDPAMLLKGFVFAAVAAALAFVSRGSLRSPRHHGFHRYLAWLALLALLLLNLDRWFHDRYAPRQLLFWMLLAVSLYLVAHGAVLLRRHGRAAPRRHDAALFEFEKTTVLVDVSVFRYIRHPLYGSLIFLAWGVYLKDPSWAATALAVTATGFMVVTALVEESECLRHFGPDYRRYMDRTKRFIPFLV